MIEAPAAPEAAIEVLVGGACELHVDDGRVLRGELQPVPDDRDTLLVQTAEGTERVPRSALMLLRLSMPHGSRPVAGEGGAGGGGINNGSGNSGHGAAAPGRALAMRLPGLETLTVQCTATHTAPHGGLWLDVKVPGGASECWHVPLRALPLLHWTSPAALARRAPPRNATELWAALDKVPVRHARHLGMALVEAGQITPAALAKALTAQTDRRERGEPHLLIGQILVQSGALGAEQLAAALADWMGVPVVDLRDFTPEREALALIPRALAERSQALPLALRDDVPRRGDGRPVEPQPRRRTALRQRRHARAAGGRAAAGPGRGVAARLRRGGAAGR
ncbi:MAG: hypothetical protein U1F49_08080 [Rubrivivax sp.]